MKQNSHYQSHLEGFLELSTHFTWVTTMVTLSTEVLIKLLTPDVKQKIVSLSRCRQESLDYFKTQQSLYSGKLAYTLNTQHCNLYNNIHAGRCVTYKEPFIGLFSQN